MMRVRSVACQVAASSHRASLGSRLVRKTMASRCAPAVMRVTKVPTAPFSSFAPSSSRSPLSSTRLGVLPLKTHPLFNSTKRMLTSRAKSDVDGAVTHVLNDVKRRDPDQPEFFQAVHEVVTTLQPLLKKKPKYIDVLRAIVEPERAITFRVPWVDDKGRQQINRGYRVQFNSAIGPYKGGLRFHPSVNLSVIKFLGFEQVFKNSLTALPMGGAKGGSDFDPKDKSDLEVMKFCKSFMTELFRHVGADVDVPAGDIGVGGREIGYLMGQYKRIVNIHQGGVLTGKGFDYGGSLMRPEATGYGLVYFTECALKDRSDTLKGKKCLVSGSGNVAQYTVMKLQQLGAAAITMSDSDGMVIEPKGFTPQQLEWIMNLKNVKRGRLSEYAKFSKTAQYVEKQRPWNVPGAQVAFPCATQNEINLEDGKALVKNGVKVVGEGANMPTTDDAIALFKKSDVLFFPAKASNAGGVATSGLEMSQNSLRMQWKAEEVDEKLKNIMQNIYHSCKNAAVDLGSPNDIQAGANAAGFIKVADAMIALGYVFPQP